MRRTFRSEDFPVSRVLEAKRGRRISVCLPARDEAATIGPIVASVRDRLMVEFPVVDEMLVVDDDSSDDTASVAEKSGAIVVRASEVLPDHPGPGKGQALWKAVHVAAGDVIVFCDSDVTNFGPGFVLGIAGPLLERDDVLFNKGFYRRPPSDPSADPTAGGGRVTELMARPLIAALFPHLSDLAQPLAGEYGAPREVLESLPFAGGYSVDLGLLIDLTARYGNTALAQTDLGERIHRNRSLSELGPQALAVLQLGLSRAGVTGFDAGRAAQLVVPASDPVDVRLDELPPLSGLTSSRKTA